MLFVLHLPMEAPGEGRREKEHAKREGTSRARVWLDSNLRPLVFSPLLA